MTRVLVVEDEESFSDALSYMLRKEGFDAVVANNGPEALAEFDRGGADVVLLDLMLPGLPGTEVCRQLRSRSSVPIIMLTAKDAEVDKVVGLELGADDYVTKPYSARELVARIRAVLRRRGDVEAPVESALEAGEVVRAWCDEIPEEELAAHYAKAVDDLDEHDLAGGPPAADAPKGRS